MLANYSYCRLQVIQLAAIVILIDVEEKLRRMGLSAAEVMTMPEGLGSLSYVFGTIRLAHLDARNME